MTYSEVPIACTLNPGEMTDRRALWERIDSAAVARTAERGGFRIAYQATEDVSQLLPSLVAAEAECCAFATWTVTRQADTLVLTVTGPDDGIEALRNEFRIDVDDR